MNGHFQLSWVCLQLFIIGLSYTALRLGWRSAENRQVDHAYVVTGSLEWLHTVSCALPAGVSSFIMDSSQPFTSELPAL